MKNLGQVFSFLGVFDKRYKMDSRNNKTLGIIFIIASAFFFALMSLSVRLAGELGVFEKMFFRNIVALVYTGIVVFRQENGFNVQGESRKAVFCRAFFGSLGVACNFYAIDHMHIADASMLNKLSPFFAMIASYFILKERTNKSDWFITLIAFFGAILVAKPSFSVEGIPAILGILGGLGAGLAYTCLRKATKNGVKGELVIFYFSLASTIIAIIGMLGGFKVLTIKQLIILLATGFFGLFGQLCITKAYTYAPAKEISTFDYSQVIFSAFFGFIFLGQIPDIYSIIGYVIIISMAILKWKINEKGN